MPAGTLVPTPLLERAASRFRLLGEPARLQLLNLLSSHDELPVQGLAEAADLSHANASKHLRLMEVAGIVARRKSGLHAYYRIADPTLSGICLLVCGQLQREAAGLPNPSHQ